MTLLRVRDPNSYEAFVYSPPDAVGPLPLLLYLHGAGEMQGDLDAVLSEGATGTPPVALARGSAPPELAHSFAVVAPHTRRGWRPAELGRFLDFLLSPSSGLALDAARLHATGHSMGGHGALVAAAATRRFAAVVPVAASGVVDAKALQGIAVWAFHGKNDVIVPSRYSEDLVQGLRSRGASEEVARLTLYEAAPAPPGWPSYQGHASTIPAYATPELYQWLLRQRLGVSAPSPAPARPERSDI